MESTTFGASTRWWLDPARVEGFVHGVFEGGGATGLLYVGALEGVLKRGLWFSAVAGSSAGAITAAMVAAGMQPEEMRAAMSGGLEAMALPTTWNGLRRVGRGTGFLDQQGVRTWLRDVLRERCQRAGVALGGNSPTFAELFEMTEIDLYVVAVDLRAGHVMVFSPTLTPECVVADAVTASSTIPVAFEPSVFATSGEDGQGGRGEVSVRLVADGGIAANFPVFVFHDAGFREYAGLGRRPEETPVVGFILDERPERREDVRDAYRRGALLGTWTEVIGEITGDRVRRVPKFRPRPGDVAGWRKPVRAVGRGLGRALGAIEVLLLKPISWLARGFEGPPWPWNWPEPKPGRSRLWLTTARRWLATAPVPLLAGIAAYTAMFWIGFAAVARWLAPDLGAVELDLESVATVVFAILLTLATLVLAAWVWLFGLGTFVLLRLAYRTLGLVGYPLFRTFLQTPAPPPWAGYAPGERAVRLRVPPGVSTLRVGSDARLPGLLAAARDATFSELDGVVGGPPPPGSRGAPESPSSSVGG